MSAVPVTSKYQIVIPREARRRLGIFFRTKFQAMPEESGFRLVKKPSIDEVRGLLKGILAHDFEIRNEATPIC
jgi:bifunctional DNA-binding transcriptional regulator/antitoxin component of YhaV-PrlF toxin-antitoxin module